MRLKVNAEDEGCLVVIVIVLFVILFFVANAQFYANTTEVFCDCQITGFVVDESDVDMSVGCASGLSKILGDASMLEYQSIPVGTPVVVVKERFNVLSGYSYKVLLNHPACTD